MERIPGLNVFQVSMIFFDDPRVDGEIQIMIESTPVLTVEQLRALGKRLMESPVHISEYSVLEKKDND